ncbi:MAG: MoaD/ThiS family protein [Candidatus Hodarchaeota archaeon]
MTKEIYTSFEFDNELTLKELLEFFNKKYGKGFIDLVWEKGKEGEFNKLLSLIINGHSYRHDKFLDTILRDGDQIVFIYIYFGG